MATTAEWWASAAVYGSIVYAYVPTYCARDSRLAVIVWLAWVKLFITACGPCTALRILLSQAAGSARHCLAGTACPFRL